MNSKNLKLFSVVLGILFLSPIFLSFLNINPMMDENVGSASVKSKDTTTIGTPLSSDTSNNDQLTTAEQIGQVLRNKWNENKWNESGSILGQKGVAGIGQYFIELAQSTSNDTYTQWAVDVADWLIYQKENNFSEYDPGKWPNKLEGNTANYTGYYEGSAGIGSFFVNLHKETGNETHLDYAEEIDNYLSEIAQPVGEGNGWAWWEKEKVTLTNAMANPSMNKVINGTEKEDTSLSNLNTYDGNTYDVQTDNTNYTETNYWTDLEDAGIPSDEENISQYITELNISITIGANTSLDGSGIYLYASSNNSWIPLQEDEIPDDSISSFEHPIDNFEDFIISDSLFQIKINSSSSSDHEINVDSLNITIDYSGEDYNSSSYYTGAAGIGTYYLDMYEGTNNESYLQSAIQAGNFTLYKQSKLNNQSAWSQKGTYFLGQRYGALGIGKFLLRLDQVVDNKTTQPHLECAIRAANWLINNSHNESLFYGNAIWFPESNATIGNGWAYSGMDYNGGIGDFLLDLGVETSNTHFLQNASLIANWLTSSNRTEMRKIANRKIFTHWYSTSQRNYPFYSQGGSGALEFLDKYYAINNSNRIGQYVSGGLEWMNKELNVSNSYWDGSGDREYNVQTGLAGIGRALLTIDIKRPEITATGYNPDQLEHSEDLELTFEINNQSSKSNLDEAIILYTKNYPDGAWSSKDLEHDVGDLYTVTLPKASYDTTYHYRLFVSDRNQTFSYDNNNNKEYTLNVVDTHSLPTSIDLLFDEGLGLGLTGKFRIKIEEESPRGADLSHVIVDIPQLDINNDHILASDFQSSDGYLTTEYTIQIDEDLDLSYGDDISISVETYDVKENVLTATESFYIIDNIAPTCNVEKDFEDAYSQWIPQFSAVKMEATVYDAGSGLDDKEGVFILYSVDEGVNWNKAYLERKSGNSDTFEGEIPGQAFLVDVYYVLGAEDKAGNYKLWDKFGTEYNDIEDIGLDASWQYSVTINVWTLLVFIAIVGGIGVVTYLIYSRKGDYLEQMRRKSKATATGLAVKERLTKFYYGLTEKIDNFGQRLVESREGFYDARIWFEDHIGERAASVLKTIGRIIWSVPLGIAHGIVYFFKGIGRMIVKSKAWQLIFYIVTGLAILLTTVLQFIMAGGYPLRAVFFMNLGFGMFITGIIAFLIRFIYKLTYK
ncbi:MAG: lanthionine synthetase LanC family protein [Promethearchaeia archaeon]